MSATNPTTLRATVERVAALAKVATPGEWRLYLGDTRVVAVVTGAPQPRDRRTVYLVETSSLPERDANAKLVVEMRNLDWDALVAALAEREGEVSRCICHGMPPHEPECARNFADFSALEKEVADLKRERDAYPTKHDLQTRVDALNAEVSRLRAMIPAGTAAAHEEERAAETAARAGDCRYCAMGDVPHHGTTARWHADGHYFVRCKRDREIDDV